ncbi:MAG: hypothetical protein HY231_18100 [Acidobacteria bacterium]|nr:hypothetical protein [Acidobacteriota bacterium]
MQKKNVIHRSLASNWHRSGRWPGLLGVALFVFALVGLAEAQRDLNRDKFEERKKPPTTNKISKPTGQKKKNKPKDKPMMQAALLHKGAKPEVKSDQATAPVGTGTLLIELKALQLDPFDEADFHILIDGIEPADKQPVSATSLELQNLPCGHYTLTFKHPTIEDYTQEVEVKMGSRLRINPMFNVVRGRLIVHGQPGATLYLDNQSASVIQENGEAIVYATIGEHCLKIVHQDGTTTQKTIYVGAGETVESGS